jgi:hypothetical protein
MTQPNEPAFARPSSYGLTKREYFAAMALQGLLANRHEDYLLTEKAVMYADALIEQLNKQP